MRHEKKFLVDEVENHLKKSDFVFLASYTGMNVPEIKELRAELAKVGAEFHVVKNAIFNVAAKNKGLPEFADLTGQVAIIVGGTDAPAVAKAVEEFRKAKEKLSFRAGVMALKPISAEDFSFMASLPPMDALRAQFLSLLSTPASSFARVLDAQAKKLEEAKA
jgi:large subunit ribosomal protein L10